MAATAMRWATKMLPRSNLDINLADLALLTDLSADEAARQRAIQRARNYHAGHQLVRLTDRLRSFLKDVRGGQDSDFLRLNVARTVTTAVTERLIVTGLQGADPALQQWAWRVWQRNRLDVGQDELHEMTVRDGEAFVLVSWDNARGMPRLVPHPRYTDAHLDDPRMGSAIRAADDPQRLVGDGVGCKAFYPDDDLSMPMEYATKRWVERRWVGGKLQVRQRLTLYRPHQVEKYELRGRGLEPIKDDPAEPWPIPWVDQAGQPLGIPVIHVRNAGLQCEAWEAIPLQNAINKLLVDLLTAADETAFRIFYALGFIPTTDGEKPRSDKSNWWRLQPGQIVGTTKAANEAEFGAVDGADIQNLITPIKELIGWTAMVTDTPVSRFIATAQVAAEGTLKQQEGPLVNKVRKRQTLIGNGWEDALLLGARLHNLYGPQGRPLVTDAEELLQTSWAPAETRDETAHIEAVALKREKLAIPVEQAWREAGYSEEQIATMRESPEYQARLALISLGSSAPQGGTSSGE